jgi:sigma-B regulation protein RsbU (phosphoserine phosphatase)
MSNLQSAVKAFASLSIQPKDLCQRLNRIFCEDVQAERSIGFFYAHIDPASRRMIFTNAGHWPPLVIHRDGSIDRLDTGGVLLGRLPNRNYEQAELKLASGDFLVLFTDGLVEAENRAEEEFGEGRIVDCVRNYRTGDAYTLQRKMLARAATHCDDRFQDDATLMIVGVQ